MRRGFRLSVSNDGAGAAAAAVVVDGDSDGGADDEVVTHAGPEGSARPPAPRHIAVRRSLRAVRRWWRRLTPVQRLVLVAVVVVACMGALRLGGYGGGQGAGGGGDLPVASLAAVKEQQKQKQQHKVQGARQQQQQQQQARRKAQAAGAGAAGRRDGGKPEAASNPGGAASPPESGAAEPTPPAPAKPASKSGKAAASTSTEVGAGGKQQKKGAATSSPLAARKRRKGGRTQQAAAATTSSSSKSKKKSSTSSTKSSTKRKASSSATASSKGDGGSTPKAKPADEKDEGEAEAAVVKSEQEHRAAAAAAAAAEEEDKKEGEGEGKEPKRLADLVEDGDALPGAADAGAASKLVEPEPEPAPKPEPEQPAEEEDEEEEEDEKEETASEGEEAAGAHTAPPKLTPGTEEELPKLFYCLPNGGFNDISVETWWCIDYARRTGRALVWGYHNYIPQVAPYTPYFTLNPIEGVTQYTQEEAAAFLYAERARRKEQGRFVRIRIHPRRLKIDFLLGEDEVGRERKAQGNPLFINAPGMPQFAFNFSVPHAKADVVVFHKIGNRGSGMDTLKHLRFSEEVKRTFLERWSQLSQPYIGLHVRSTDRSCPREKIERLLKHTRNLQRSRALKGADVYLATDNPEDSEEFLLHLRDEQQRAIHSFTFMPEENEDGERVPLHLNRNLKPADKHQTNVDGFVDLLLLAFCDHFIKTCGGYGRLAQHLHKDKKTALHLIGEELEEGQDVNDVLAAAVERMRAEKTAGAVAGAGVGGVKEESRRR